MYICGQLKISNQWSWSRPRWRTMRSFAWTSLLIDKRGAACGKRSTPATSTAASWLSTLDIPEKLHTVGLFERMIRGQIQRRVVQPILQGAGRTLRANLRVARRQQRRDLDVIRSFAALGSFPSVNPGVDYLYAKNIRHGREEFPPLGGLPPLAESPNEAIAPSSSGSLVSATTLDCNPACGEEDDDGG